MNKLKILQDLKDIEIKLNKTTSPNISINLKETQFLMLGDGKKIKYLPNPTLKRFHENDDPIRFVMGPYGSGKSSGLCAEILFRAISMPPCKDGKRRSKWAIIRNTSGELETTTLQTWLYWFDELGTIESHKKPVMTYKHTFRVEGMTEMVELELIFLALDRADDIKKLKSLEITAAYLNELSELPEELLPHLKSRISRYPSASMVKNTYWAGIIADSNPPDVDGWIYRLFEIEKPEGYSIFKQPPALIEEDNTYVISEIAENIKNHNNPKYYLDLARGATREFVKVYCMGEYGTVLFGKKVYENYNDDLHSKENLEVEKDSELILGWDFGLTPACLIAQLTKGGQIRVLKEFCTDYLSVRELADNIVVPYINSVYKGYNYSSVGDPSDRPSDSTKQSCIQILNECGIHTSKAVTNDIIPRIDAVKQYLSKLTDGNPAIIISKDNCPVLRKGFLGKYNYKRLRVIGETKFTESPDKTHPYSDIQDCLQYICLEFYYKTKQNVTLSKDFYKPVPAWC